MRLNLAARERVGVMLRSSCSGFAATCAGPVRVAHPNVPPGERFSAPRVPGEVSALSVCTCTGADAITGARSSDRRRTYPAYIFSPFRGLVAIAFLAFPGCVCSCPGPRSCFIALLTVWAFQLTRGSVLGAVLPSCPGWVLDDGQWSHHPWGGARLRPWGSVHATGPDHCDRPFCGRSVSGRPSRPRPRQSPPLPIPPRRGGGFSATRTAPRLLSHIRKAMEGGSPPSAGGSL